MASLLRSLGVGQGDRVGLLALNTPQSIEAHYAIPAAGGVIVSFNPWLRPEDIRKQIDYSGAKVLLVSRVLAQRFQALLEELSSHRIVLLDAPMDAGEGAAAYLCFESSHHSYDASASLDQALRSENDPIAINFTSGTTGEPKGVVYSHRAAYLHALGQVVMMKLSASSVYYWSLPMFHVNGWGHMWATVAVGARQVVGADAVQDPATLHAGIGEHAVTHLAGSPRLVQHLMSALFDAVPLSGLTVLTGGAAPTPALVETMQRRGVDLIHQYGLNETCGPFVVCEARDGWDALPESEQVRLRLRQGVAALHAGSGLRVVDEAMRDVAWDGESLGEVLMQGNTVAQGYFNNPSATARAFADGWFHSGDVAVVHPDGYIEIKDRMKDLIYVETPYGWENISSIEIENVASQLPGLKDVAVIGFGEGEKQAQIILFYEKSGAGELDEQHIYEHCRSRLPGFKVPAYFFETPIPKTATGKVMKNLLKDRVSKRLAAETGPD
jgi:fatty-acyl-CoA synthase